MMMAMMTKTTNLLKPHWVYTCAFTNYSNLNLDLASHTVLVCSVVESLVVVMVKYDTVA